MEWFYQIGLVRLERDKSAMRDTEYPPVLREQGHLSWQFSDGYFDVIGLLRAGGAAAIGDIHIQQRC